MFEKDGKARRVDKSLSQETCLSATTGLSGEERKVPYLSPISVETHTENHETGLFLCSLSALAHRRAGVSRFI